MATDHTALLNSVIEDVSPDTLTTFFQAAASKFKPARKAEIVDQLCEEFGATN